MPSQTLEPSLRADWAALGLEVAAADTVLDGLAVDSGRDFLVADIDLDDDPAVDIDPEGTGFVADGHIVQLVAYFHILPVADTVVVASDLLVSHSP